MPQTSHFSRLLLDSHCADSDRRRKRQASQLFDAAKGSSAVQTVVGRQHTFTALPVFKIKGHPLCDSFPNGLRATFRLSGRLLSPDYRSRACRTRWRAHTINKWFMLLRVASILGNCEAHSTFLPCSAPCRSYFPVSPHDRSALIIFAPSHCMLYPTSLCELDDGRQFAASRRASPKALSPCPWEWPGEGAGG